MNHAKTRKTQDQSEAGDNLTKQRDQQETIDILIRGIDALIAIAEEARMGMATRIFYTAKEELVHWGVTINCHESPEDRFINHHLYDDRLARLESLIIRALSHSATRSEMLGLLGLPLVKPHSMK